MTPEPKKDGPSDCYRDTMGKVPLPGDPGYIGACVLEDGKSGQRPQWVPRSSMTRSERTLLELLTRYTRS